MHKSSVRIFIALIIAFALALGGGSVFATPVGQSAPLNDLSGLNITSSGSNVARTAGARGAEEINGLDYSTFAAAVAQAASASKVLRLPPGSYNYGSGTALTISIPVIFEPGAVLTCSGANVAFTNVVQAPRSQIFASGCTPSFSGNVRQVVAYPEWWGALGNSDCATIGNGADNKTPLNNALSSGIVELSLAPGACYRFTGTLSTTASHFSVNGAGFGSTLLFQDDSTQTADGFLLYGHGGQVNLHGVNFQRAQPALGYVVSAQVIAGGSGYAVNDTITLAGGTFATAAVLKVTSVSSGAITGVSVQTPGAYTKPIIPTVNLTVFPAVVQASTSGSGTGAQFSPMWSGPAIVHLQDTYYVTLDHNFIGGTNAWDGIRIDGINYQSNSIYIESNEIKSGEHDGVYLVGATTTNQVGGINIGEHNDIWSWGLSAVEGRGWLQGVIIEHAGLYGNAYGLYFDAMGGAFFSNKFTRNDIDTNSLGDFFNQLNESHYQENWHSDAGPFVCTACTNIAADGNFFTTPASAISLNGSTAMNFGSTHVSGGTGAVLLGPYNGAQTSQISFAGSTYQGAGYFLSWTGSPFNITVGVQLANTSSAVANPSATMNGLTVLGPTSPSNNANNTMAGVLYGANNTVGSAYGAAGGSYNSVYGYASSAYGANNNAFASFSNVRGSYAADDNVVGADCVASGSTTGNAGAQEHCTHILRARSSSTSATRLTADGNAAGSANCINLPGNSAMSFSIRVVGFNGATTGTAAWTSNGSNLLVHGSGSTMTYVGDFSSATAVTAANTNTMANAYTGGSASTLQLSADSTNTCLNVTVVPPDANTWDWAAYVSRVKIQ